MKIKTIEIEATADELRNSTTLSQAITNILRNAVLPVYVEREEDDDEADSI